MLNVDHVRAKRQGERLVLLELAGPKRARALEIAGELITRLQGAEGESRDRIDTLLAELELRPSERRTALGLTKLLLDAAEFEPPGSVDPVSLRRQVFLEAAAVRRTASFEQPFSREAVIASAASALELSPAALDEALYADLRGAERLVRAARFSAEELVRRYDAGQVQAVLLRAVRVVVDVQCASSAAFRSLFQKLKFRKLLYRAERREDGAYRLTIDGPYSLFEAVTKYGLELALLLPALEACDRFELRADVLWGTKRVPLVFEHRHVRAGGEAEPVRLRDELVALRDDFAALDSLWSVEVADEILHQPDGVCVPDLVFRRKGKSPVYFELLGYWSRDAVFHRIELAERGLGKRVVFGVSSKLRVSDKLLEPGTHAALYVFRGKPNARALERLLEAFPP